MKSREISRSKIGPFSLACIGIGWEYQFTDCFLAVCISVISVIFHPKKFSLLHYLQCVDVLLDYLDMNVNGSAFLQFYMIFCL